jgi:hypothetical protein
VGVLLTNLVFRYKECEEFDHENVRSLNMTVAVMFRYFWYGTVRLVFAVVFAYRHLARLTGTKLLVLLVGRSRGEQPCGLSPFLRYGRGVGGGERLNIND